VSQQINLFNPIFLKQKKYFSAVTMAQALGLILLGSILLVFYTNYQLAMLEREATSVSGQLVLAQAQLARVTADYGPRPKSKSLEEEIQNAEAEVKSLQQVVDVLKNGQFGNTKGYSAYLRAFSRQIVSGLWLTDISLIGAGNEIGMKGRTVNPALVPAYISRLKREPVMQGTSFATLEMQVPQIDPARKDETAKPQMAGYIDFSLQSAEKNNDEKSSGSKDPNARQFTSYADLLPAPEMNGAKSSGEKNQ
jgi:hypothetical protein